MSSNFIVYLIGYLLIVAGVAFGMSAAGIDQTWIIVVVLVMAGIGIIYAFGRSQTDEASRSQRSQTTSSSSNTGSTGSTGTTGNTGSTGTTGSTGSTGTTSGNTTSSDGPHT